MDIKRRLLDGALSVSGRAVSKSDQVPIEKCVAISSDGKHMKLQSSNTSRGMRITYFEECDGELPQVAVNYSKLSQLVGTLDGDIVSLSIEDNRLLIECGEISVRLGIQDPDVLVFDFPVGDKVIDVTGREIKSSFRKSLFVSGKVDYAGDVSGSLLLDDYIITTDGVAAIAAVKFHGGFDARTWILSACAYDISRIISNSDSISIYKRNSGVSLVSSKVRIDLNLLDVKMNVKQMIVGFEPEYVFSVSAEDLANILETAEIVARDFDYYIAITAYDNGQLLFQSSNAFEASCNADVKKETKMAVNCQRLKNVAKNCASDRLDFAIFKGGTGIIIDADKNTRYMLGQMRIRS